MPAFDIHVSDGCVARHAFSCAFYDLTPAGRPRAFAEPTRLRRRGLYGNFTCRLESTFPLGLVFCRRRVRLPERITVYPPPRRPGEVQELLSGGIGPGGSWNRRGDDYLGELYGLREHRPGDSVRQIAWSATSRLQKLIVRETENPGPTRVRVIFHSYRPGGVALGRKSFEKALQLLAGVFAVLAQRNIEYGFAAAFTGWRIKSIAPTRAGGTRALCWAAVARHTQIETLEPLRELLERESDPEALTIVVSNTPRRYWESECRQWLGNRSIMLDTRDAGSFMRPLEVTL